VLVRALDRAGCGSPDLQEVVRVARLEDEHRDARITLEVGRPQPTDGAVDGEVPILGAYPDDCVVDRAVSIECRDDGVVGLLEQLLDRGIVE
jgi:hypothetical protein